jgi:hypothetical protein
MFLARRSACSGGNSTLLLNSQFSISQIEKGAHIKMKTCPNCSKSSGDQADFCDACGYRLTSVSSLNDMPGFAGPSGGSNLPALPEGYAFKAAMNFKKGKFAIWANVIVGIVMIAAIVAAGFMFPIHLDDGGIGDLAVDLLLFIVIFLAFMVANMLITLIGYKIGRGGKIKFHVGLMLDIYCEKAVTRRCYILTQFFTGLVPIAVLSAAAVFVWTNYVFVLLCVILSNFLTVMIPIYSFIRKYDKTAFVHFYRGSLNVFTREKGIEN